MLYAEIATGLGMMVLTVILHALFMVGSVRTAEWCRTRFGPFEHELARAVLLSVLTVFMFLAIVLEALIWACLYRSSPMITALPDLVTAFYFSMVTYTTLGYGDVVLTGSWRVMASIQAANGVIIFGWTTALIFFFIQKIYRKTDS